MPVVGYFAPGSPKQVVDAGVYRPVNPNLMGANVGKPGNTGIIRIINAAKYSSLGLTHAWRHEAAFRQEVTASLVLIPAAFWLGQTPVERSMLIASCLFVLVIELINSAIEAAIDRHGPEIHELSGRAKDLGSAAVMMSLLILALVWGGVAYQRFVI